MARTRDLKPSFFTNEELAQLPPLARLLFQGLWCHADRVGRLEDRPARLRVQILPYDVCDPDDLLSKLAAAGFIRRYQVEDAKLIQILKFSKHQSPHPKEPASTLPPPPERRAAERPGEPRQAAEFPEQAGNAEPCGAALDLLHSFPSGDLIPGASEVPPPAPARDPAARCTGYTLTTAYGQVRATAMEGRVEPWRTPFTRDGKAETFAASLSPEEAYDARATMTLHFAELKAGRGKAGALENPTFGFGCWMAEFTALRERLHGKTPMPARSAARAPPRPATLGQAAADNSKNAAVGDVTERL